MYSGEENISTFYTETCSHLFNHRSSNSPDTENTIWRNTGYQFSRPSIYLYETRVRVRSFACENTCGTLEATHMAGSETDLRCKYRIGLLCIKRKEKMNITKVGYKQQVSSKNNPMFWSLDYSLPTSIYPPVFLYLVDLSWVCVYFVKVARAKRTPKTC